MSFYIILALLALLVFLVVSVYNRFVRNRNLVKDAWSNIDVALKRRYDLIPNLVETVKGYAAHEKETFEKVIQARNAAMAVPAGDINDQIKAENQLQQSLRSLFALGEAYPDLKANTNFLQLQDKLNEIEENLERSRRYYNGTVRENNTYGESFPGVLFASIMNDMHRAAGRSGVGAVMGSKNLKAVVVKGTHDVPVHNEQDFGKLAKDYLKQFKQSYKDQAPPLRTYGTAITIVGTQNTGVLPTRNFQQGTFEEWQKIGGEALTENYLSRPSACFHCPIGCGRVTKITEGPYKGSGEGPEYETVYALGSNCGVSDLAALTKANYVCNEMGMDTISMGATIAAAMEMFEKGIIDVKDIGQSLNFGDGKALVDMCFKTALRKGFGKELAVGSLRMAKKYGHPELAIVAKGQEFAGYDPRGEKGMGLAYATSSIGASHMRGDPAYIEILGVPMQIDPLTWEDKPQIVKDWQDTFAVIDSAGLCVFFSVRNLVTPTRDIQPDGILNLLNFSTGFNYDIKTLLQAGERIVNAERLYLSRAGFSAEDDSLPVRILKEPLPDGPAKGHVCELEKMLPPYYKLRGWNINGMPTAEKINELGLAWD